MAKPKKPTQDEKKLFSILTYPFFIVGLIWYLVDENMQKDKFAKFHFKQSLVLVIAYLIVWIAVSILWFIPYLPGILYTLAWIAFLVLAVLGIINAANHEEKELPVIGGYAKKLKF
ncbi:DUF4870 domain-containing protein [Candidatus Woesearchaeota archaeon]|nr:DUF4870 domain-containing protein [Candidatus Woesearchaeota archaeon]